MYSEINYSLGKDLVGALLLPVEKFGNSCGAGGECVAGELPTYESDNPDRVAQTATVVGSKPAVGMTIPEPVKLVEFAMKHTFSDTVDDQEETKDNEEEAETPEIDEKIFEKKSYDVPTAEDMECWLFKWWVLKGAWNKSTQGDITKFREYMMKDGTVDSGRVSGTGVKKMIEWSEMWVAVRNRALEHVVYYLDNDIDFEENGIPDPYCNPTKSLTDEEADEAYKKELEENPSAYILGPSKESKAEKEYGNADEIDEDEPPESCSPKWAYRKCRKSDKKLSSCKKLKGPEREQCQKTVEDCTNDPDTCVKREGLEAFSAFMKKFDNVKMFYLAVILLTPLLTLMFPPFVLVTGPLGVFSVMLLPWVLWMHFYRLFGPGSSFFKALPYFIRWYFWYPIVLLVSKPLKLFKIWGKGISKFFTKTIPKGFSWLFGKQIPKLVKKIMKPIIKFFSAIFKSLKKVFKAIIKAVMGAVKAIAKFFENVGRVFSKLGQNVKKVVKGVQEGFKKLTKAFKKIPKALKGLQSMGKKIEKVFKKIR
tara:strand:+ start:609 stop:2216 length:1608 start_codon:yes stop_codon:yes gene_type:complete